MSSKNKPLPDQKGLAVWLFGLSGSGKTTISNLLKEKIEENGHAVISLDGDVLREGINKDLSFTEADREENIRRAAEIASILVKNKLIVLCSFITPLQKHRNMASSIVGKGYYEVFVDCPVKICQQRDVKGLYRRAGLNQLENFPGISSAFEASESSNLHLTTHIDSKEQCVAKIYDQIIPYLQS